MKRIKLKINNTLKGTLLVLSLLGGSYALSKSKPATAIKFGFTFSILASVKKKNPDISEDDIKFFKALDVAMQEQLIAWEEKHQEDLLGSKGFAAFMKDPENVKAIMAALDVKDAKVGDKTIEEHLKAYGTEVANAMKSLKTGGAGEAIDLKKLFDEAMPDIESVLKQKKNDNYHTINVKAAVTMRTDNTIDADEVEAVGDITDSFSFDGFVPKRQDRQYIYDIASRTFVADLPKYITWLEESDSEGALALVAEGAVKPLMSFSLVKNISEAYKAAGKIIVTEEFVKWKKYAWSVIQDLFRDKVRRDYEDILTSNLIASAAPYAGTTLDGTIVNPTKYHAIAAVAAYQETLNFNPDTLIINPQDKWGMALLQDENGRWYTNIIVDGVGEQRIMGFRVVTSNKMPAGSFILGEAGLWKIKEEAVQIRVGYGVSMNGGVAESDFDHNRFRVIGELYFHNYIASNHTGSFVLAQYSTIMEALQAPVNP